MEEIDKSTTFERGFFGKSSFFYGANSLVVTKIRFIYDTFAFYV